MLFQSRTAHRVTSDRTASGRAVSIADANRAAAAGKRDLRLDFFRGLALFFIFIDHIPENTLSLLTLSTFGFSDAAEVFIFISGYTAALVYGQAMLRTGPLFAAAQIFRRVWQLYVAHIFLFVIFTAEVSYIVERFNNPMYNDELRVGDFLAEPHVAIIKALLLQFQPTFLDILPLYIVLLAFFPLVLLAQRVHVLLPLVPSFLLYVLVGWLGFSVRGYPAGHVWFFNPFAWQFLFVIGATMGYAQIAQRVILPRGRGIFAAAAILLAVATIVKVSWTIHDVYDPVPALFLKQLWPMNKSNLAPLRLIHFLLLAYVVARLVAPSSPVLRSALARPVIICGQHSLQIFCLSILLSLLGHFVLTEWRPDILAQLLVTAGGIAIMVGTAKLLGWYKDMDRAAGKPPPSAVADAGKPGAVHRHLEPGSA
jgi:hypothetical protein